MKQFSFARLSKPGAAMILALGLAAGLSGCSGYDGVELQGGIFDALGVSAATKTKASEPKVARRNSLVIPPDTKALPAPGSGQIASQGAQSWPTNPEDAKIAKAAFKEKNLAKYCDDRKWWKQSNPEEFDRATRNGELCLSPIAKIYSKKKKN